MSRTRWPLSTGSIPTVSSDWKVANGEQVPASVEVEKSARLRGRCLPAIHRRERVRFRSIHRVPAPGRQAERAERQAGQVVPPPLEAAEAEAEAEAEAVVVVVVVVQTDHHADQEPMDCRT